MTFMKTRRSCYAVTILLSLAVLCIMHKPILVFMANWLDVGEPPRAADFAMVLPGGSERRPFVAALMLRAGLVEGILTSRTETDPANDEGLSPESDDLMRRVLKLRGVREDQILVLPGHSNSTWTDAVALLHFLQERPQAMVSVITDGYHTRRSRWVFHRVMGKDASRVFFVSAPWDSVSPNTWWLTQEGLNTYLAEYLKFVAYVATDRKSIGIALGMIFATLLGWTLWRRRSHVRSDSVPIAPSHST